jgi:hypothetical protein
MKSSAILASLLLLSAPLLASPGPASPAPDSLTVHEWGTFTSFAGSDGVSLEFRTTPREDLPSFVLDRAQQSDVFLRRYKAGDRSGYGSKSVVTSQRMETPVTYFYTDKPRTINVTVQFPKGLLTEFYPPVSMMMPVYNPKEPERVANSSLSWNNVKLIPPALADSSKLNLPPTKGDDHYAHARNTDSAYVQLNDTFLKQTHTEKFLFYRGVGNFTLPLTLVSNGNNQFTIQSQLAQPIPAFLVNVQDGKVRYAATKAFSPQVSIALPATESSIDSLSADLVKALVAEGLYEKEATAMLQTWRSSWFGEDGTRLLYLLPQKLTDQMLPLKIMPAPTQTVRIMVGRLETLTPEMESRIASLITGLDADSVKDRDAATSALASLGRFAEPSLQRLSKSAPSPETRTRAKALLIKLQK